MLKVQSNTGYVINHATGHAVAFKVKEKWKIFLTKNAFIDVK